MIPPLSGGKHWSRWLLWLAVIGGMVHLLATGFRTFSRPGTQPDFKVYYYGARAAGHGASPYGPTALEAEAGHPVAGRFLYPPATLRLFEPFTRLEERQAASLFLALKLLGIGVLLGIWVRHFNPWPETPWWLLALALHALGRPLVLDLKAGNISVFEELGLWWAFLFYLRGRLIPFCLLVAAVASFKLTPILMLGLGLLSGSRRERWIPVATGVAFAALVLNPMLYPEGAVGAFFRAALGQDERGSMNPCGLAWIRDASGWLQRETGLEIVRLSPGLYLAYLMTIVAVAALIYWRRGATLQRIDLLMLILFVYALCVPRFKNYSYLLMMVPLAHILATTVRGPAARIGLLALTCIHVIPYQQFYTLLILYGAFAAQHLSAGREPIQGSLPHPALT